MAPPVAKPLSVRVGRISAETPQVRTFRLELPEGGSFDFIPGQFIRLSFPGEDESRDYSVASSPLEKGFIEITLSRAGKFTERLFELRTGDEMVVRGPYGRWHYHEGAAHSVLVSGGTGIAPLRSMIRYVLGRELRDRLSLFYSARTPEDIVYRDELERLGSKGVSVQIFITRPESPRASAWRGPVGRISAQTLKKGVADFEKATYYLCGPAGLVSDLTSGLAKAGVPQKSVHSEIWGEF